jgi:outer membrane lipoprotein-sorting protein
VRVILAFVAAIALASQPASALLAAPQDNLNSVLARLDVAAANFHSTSADVEFDQVETDPVPDTDAWKGVAYYERKDAAVRMGVHFTQHNGKPSGKAYTYIGGTFKVFEPGINQVTTYTKAAKWEGYVILGFGASGKDLQAKWDIKDLGQETLDGVKTEELELIAKDLDVRRNVSKVDIWVDADHAVSLKQVFTLSATSTYTCHYSNFKFNASLPGDAFSFKTNRQTVERTQ